MSLLDWFKSPVNKGLDLADQLIDDGDLSVKLKAAFYLQELRTKTIPLLDGLHKLGRQLLALVQVGFYAWASQNGVEITWELVAGVSGATGAYTLVKGKGG
ncbi:hypothetical protein [Ferrimonas balearica]|uniref:hypothetical protein n=1 Tax=Ferrimonas balearica TaxID=44012 RepID=UPI001C98F8C3|nr:hypothetical protein [Ferrimonas balearica]MBY5920423.1 hypothetical protein [Ferrimonas balearica]MBY5996892.1 hypothetical protein [Ferrimonas balearica]